VNYCSTIFVGQNVSEESDEICRLVVVLLAVLGVAVRRMELRCRDFLKTPKEGTFGFERSSESVGSLTGIQGFAMHTL